MTAARGRPAGYGDDGSGSGSGLDRDGDHLDGRHGVVGAIALGCCAPAPALIQ